MKVIAVINQKGGVGKSSTVQAIGAGLILKGYKVLLIDLDAQGNLSYSMGATASPERNSFRILLEPEATKETIIATEQGDIIPSIANLSGAEKELDKVGKEYKLKEAINTISEEYDYIILDTPPALSILTINALTSCNEVIIPAQADIYSLQGITQLSDTIQVVKKYCNPLLSIKGILLTRYNSRAVITKEITELLSSIASSLDTKVFNAKIRECTALKEAQALKKSIYKHSPRSNATVDYKQLIEELLEE